MRPTAPPDYLAGYPPALVEPVRRRLADGSLGGVLRQRYPHRHAVRTDRALYEYVQEIKNEHLRNTAPLASRISLSPSLVCVRDSARCRFMMSTA